MADAFFTPTSEPDMFGSTELTQGPWSPGTQHAGPPAALLVRAAERVTSSIVGPSQLVRVAFDILGPVPVAPLRVRAEVLRPGRAVELVEATLSAGDRPVMTARAWRIRSTALSLPLAVAAQPPAAQPESVEQSESAWPGGYLTAIEWRFVAGQFEKPGPARVWTRLRVPVVAGEEPSGLQRAAAVADSGNGLSGLLDPADWWFINTELTVHVHRQPVGEWIMVDARSTLDPAGVGLAETELADRSGGFGRGAQALMVGPR